MNSVDLQPKLILDVDGGGDGDTAAADGRDGDLRDAAAESLEKLMDATREELSDTMAAVRLSGMEISDLTMSSVTMVPIRNSSASDLASSWR
ncbi:hypothetical protein SASPL_141561 [Salvia splendens]|uniref:Uncharacterized protein n=1 Tax=Salvia splendens TaxID=180675 RepID=A0A8X8WRW2_SALSN|nr:hypothetical protein SASPL_141561 [Salvia splendens]